MRWVIDGADKATGDARTFSVEADSAEEAEQLARQRSFLVASVKPLEGETETFAGRSSGQCANCGDLIGKLETSHVWTGNVVCARCFAKLSGSRVLNASPVRPAPSIRRSDTTSSVVQTTDQVVWRVIIIIIAICVFAGGVGALLTALASM